MLRTRRPSLRVCFLVCLVGCTSLPRNPGAIADLVASLVPDSVTQPLIDLGSKYQAADSGVRYLDQLGKPEFHFISDAFTALDNVAVDLGVPIETPVALTPAQQDAVNAIIQDTETRWLNKYGWIRGTPSDAANGYDNENPSLFTSEYLWLLWRLGALRGPLRDKYFTAIKNQVKEMELQPGLYDRFPVSLRGKEVKPFSHDETLGLIVLDYVFDKQEGFAKDQYDYGQKHDYNYMNPAWSAYEKFDRPIYQNGVLITKAQELPYTQRYGALIEIIRRTGGADPSAASDLILCGGLLTALSDSCDQTSVPIMAVLQASVLKHQTSALDGCIYQFNYLAKDKFAPGKTCGGKPVTCANSFCAMANIYFSEDHPIARLSKFLPAN